jgi:cyanate permease
MPVGFAIALLTAPVLLPAFGWRMLWGGLAALSMLAMLFLLPKLRFGAPATQLRAIDVLSQTRLWLLSFAFGTYAFQWVTVMAWLPTYLMDDLGLVIGAASVSTAFVVAANVPGNLLAGSLMRRGVTPGWLIAIGSVAMAVTATGLFLGAATGPRTGLGLCLVFSAFGGLIPSVLFAQIPRLSPTPDYAAQANGMLMQGSATGQFIGPPIVGAAVAASVGAWSGAVAPLIAMALLTVVTGVLSTLPSQKPKLASE